MATGQRVVAELGRPETPAETAARKAASSAAYRGSQTFRNLIVALVVTLGVVLVVVFGVPRGELPTADSIDPAPIAAQAAQTYDREIVVPVIPDAWLVNDEGEPVPDAWRVNVAEVSGDGGTQGWTIAYVPDTTSFLRVAQGFDADEAWARSVLAGQSPDGEIDIDGIAWTVYEIDDPASAGNVSYALGTQAGVDHVLVYGSADPDTAARLASLMTGQVRVLEEATS